MSYPKTLFCCLSALVSLWGFGVGDAQIKIQSWRSQAGVPVYFVQRPSVPMLDITVLINAGSIRDGNKPGLASFVASMLDEGSKNYDANSLAQAWDLSGAQFDAQAQRDYTRVHLRTMTQAPYLNQSLNLFHEVLTRPNFPSQSIERVRKQLIEALKQADHDPEQLAIDRFFALLYANTPYAHSPLGDLQTAQKINQKNLIDFYNTYYVTQAMRLVMVGSVNLEQARAISEQVLLTIKLGQAPAQINPINSNNSNNLINIKKHEIIPRALSQHVLVLGQVGINRKNPDYFSLIVANYVLGGGEMNSRLFDTVRNKAGLAYSVYSQFAPLELNGPFVINLQTRACASQEALTLVDHTVTQFLQQGPDAAELNLAKNDLIHSLALRLADNAGLLAQLEAIAFYDLPTNYLENYAQRIAAVTPQMAKQAFIKLIHPDDWVRVQVGQGCAKN